MGVDATAPSVLESDAASVVVDLGPPADGCKLHDDCQTGEEVPCIVCGRTATGRAHWCRLCMYVAHAPCGDSEGNEGHGTPVVCKRCRPSGRSEI